MADAAPMPEGFISESDANAMAPSEGASPGVTNGSQAMPAGFIPEAQAEQSAGDRISDIPGMSTLSAFSRGVGTGLAGPALPWIASKMGETPEQAKSLTEGSPLATGLGEATGLIGGSLTGTGVGGLANAAGHAVPAIAGKGLLAGAANGALRSAAEMAVIGAGDKTAKMMSDPSLSAETALSDVGADIAFGAGFGGLVGGVVSPLWKATFQKPLQRGLESLALKTAGGLADGESVATMRPILKKALSTFGGVSEDDISAYLKHHADIKSIPEYQEVYEHALDHIGGISDAVESGKMSVSEAKASFKEFESTAQQQLREQGADAASASNLAKQALKESQTKLANDLLSQAMNTGNRAAGAVDALRSKVIDASSASYDLLDNSSISIPTTPFIDKAAEVANELRSETTLEARSQADRIEEYAKNVQAQHGELMSGPDAKKMIQGLDKISKYDFNASTFDKGLSNSYKELRFHLDDTLKDAVPEYREAMKPLAKDSQLLGKLKKYGTEEGATTRIKSLKNPDAFKNDMPLLRQLEDSTGSKFVHDIEPYANGDLRNKLMKAMPEYGEAQKTADQLAGLKHPRTKAALETALEQFEQYKALADAQAKLQTAQAAKDELKGVTSQNLQGKLNSLKKPGKNIANETILSQIPELQGKSIPQIMDLMRLQEAFTKDATRGSKHVNLYGAVAAGIGATLTGGLGGGFLGAATGAIAGAAADRMGPSGIAKLLDFHVANLEKISGENPKLLRTLAAKIMGSEQGPNAEAFKTASSYVSSITAGDKNLSKAVKGLFSTGTIMLHREPTEMARLKLDKLVAENQNKPQDQIDRIANSSLQHYFPDHQGALATAAASQLRYLSSIKPQEKTLGLMDKKVPVSNAQEARYQRAQDIAINPNVVFQHIKDGTLQSTDIVDYKTMWPSLYGSAVQKMASEMATAQQQGHDMPYKTRMSYSMFLSQPMDNTMTPLSIMAAQPQPTQSPPQQGGKMKGGAKTATTMDKNAKSYQTGPQSAESDRNNRD